MRILFLERLLSLFKRLFFIDNQPLGERIPVEIDNEEIIYRAVFDPLQASLNKKKIKEKAFQPPPDSNELSVYRFNYTTLSRCVEAGRKINIKDNKFIGFAANTKGDIVNVSEKISIVYSPLDENQNPLKDVDRVYSNQKGTPFHSDIIYDRALNIRIKEPNSEFRMIAKKLAKQSEYISLPDNLS